MKHVNILIADDEAEIADLVGLHLEKEGFHIFKVNDGEEALKIVQSQPIDLAVLDIMMPRLDGHEVTRMIREQNYLFPIIFLSAKTSDFDRITGLVIGADDYMTKPFNPMELVARVKSQLRRTMLYNQSASKENILEFRGLTIDPDQHKVTKYDTVLSLTPKEFDILLLLANHPNKVFSAEHIFQTVWGDAYYDNQNTVMVHIRTLRKKLGEDKNEFIKTVWGVGYAFHG
ncbi:MULTISPECIES: response regulator transcription factor [Cytobacillus]|uniref:response regulator transcription factor n=1 Tax=Cytobacillus TaxID=2675230 RepID=UPI001CD2D73E|nr:response regulator transcription factor [Cytobacillus kochii]MCA1026527.1 response regulator transcription factor [Cytobacillus kochii]MCM3322322.1 response regulator transcription factor [Cytobacillus kochii]MCM3345199.1 response regulator transcription factor [Cytobacillus kochii]MDM5209754.1 response regulator transcription factor [Cytobacillus kochii]